MTVTVDDQTFSPIDHGLTTFGELLAHIRREKRLVVHVLIDGEEPDMSRLGSLRSSPLLGHTCYVETTDPIEMSRDVLNVVAEQLDEAQDLTTETVNLLRAGQPARAMEKLQTCFTNWQTAQDSVGKVGQLINIDLASIVIQDKPFTDVLATFAEQLRTVRQALENRDFVSLTDTLAYEMTETNEQWLAAVRAMHELIV